MPLSGITTPASSASVSDKCPLAATPIRKSLRQMRSDLFTANTSSASPGRTVSKGTLMVKQTEESACTRK